MYFNLYFIKQIKIIKLLKKNKFNNLTKITGITRYQSQNIKKNRFNHQFNNNKILIKLKKFYNRLLKYNFHNPYKFKLFPKLFPINNKN